MASVTGGDGKGFVSYDDYITAKRMHGKERALEQELKQCVSGLVLDRRRFLEYFKREKEKLGRALSKIRAARDAPRLRHAESRDLRHLPDSTQQTTHDHNVTKTGTNHNYERNGRRTGRSKSVHQAPGVFVSAFSKQVRRPSLVGNEEGLLRDEEELTMEMAREISAKTRRSRTPGITIHSADDTESFNGLRLPPRPHSATPLCQPSVLITQALAQPTYKTLSADDIYIITRRERSKSTTQEGISNHYHRIRTDDEPENCCNEDYQTYLTTGEFFQDIRNHLNVHHVHTTTEDNNHRLSRKNNTHPKKCQDLTCPRHGIPYDCHAFALKDEQHAPVPHKNDTKHSPSRPVPVPGASSQGRIGNCGSTQNPALFRPISRSPSPKRISINSPPQANPVVLVSPRPRGQRPSPTTDVKRRTPIIQLNGEHEFKTPSSEELDFFRRALSDSTTLHPGLLSPKPPVTPPAGGSPANTGTPLLRRRRFVSSSNDLRRTASLETDSTELFEIDDMKPITRQRSSTFSGYVGPRKS